MTSNLKMRRNVVVVLVFYIINNYYLWELVKCKKLEGTSQNGICKEIGLDEGSIILSWFPEHFIYHFSGKKE